MRANTPRLTSSDRLRVRLRTDESVTARGFELRAKPVCGGVLVDASGTLCSLTRDQPVSDSDSSRASCGHQHALGPGRAGPVLTSRSPIKRAVR